MMDSSIRIDTTKNPADKHYAGVGYEYYVRNGVCVAICDTENRLRTCVSLMHVWRKWPAKDEINAGMTVYVIDERKHRLLSEDKKAEKDMAREGQNKLEKEPAKVLKPESKETYDAAQATKTKLVTIFEVRMSLDDVQQPLKYLFLIEHYFDAIAAAAYKETVPCRIVVDITTYTFRREIADKFKKDMRMGPLRPIEEYVHANNNPGVPIEGA
jgi:hypothetical protein